MNLIIEQLTHPTRLWSRAEVLVRPSPVPQRPGIYAWYFRNLSGCVDPTNCVSFKDSTLLYMGISPKEPSQNGERSSRQTLRSRIRSHFRRDADASTLRLTLGCLLSQKLGIELRRVGAGDRTTFAIGEQKVSSWMEENANVVWVECDEPWKVEREVIATLSLPLNLQHNQHHAFWTKLSLIRADARKMANALPIIPRR
jgi:hypothetical protein